MSKIVDLLYKKAPERPMSPRAKAAYLILLCIALISLVTVYYDQQRQLLHQVCTTAGLAGAIAVAAVSEIRKNGFAAYAKKSLPRDIGVLVIWIVLLVIWVKNPTVEMLED